MWRAAVPELLDLVDVEGDVVTCNKDTEDYFNEFYSDISSKTMLDKGHGRIEKREYRLLTDLSWLEQKDTWKKD